MENTVSIVDDVTAFIARYEEMCLPSRCLETDYITPLIYCCLAQTAQKTQPHILLRNLATDCLLRICLRGNLFTNTLPSNTRTCNNMIRSLECQAMCESGSLKRQLKYKLKYKSDGVGDHHVRWDTDGIEPTRLKLNSLALVRKRTTPTERPPLVSNVSANFCGRGCRVVSATDSHGR
jgi:hypothetical protein